MSLTTRPPGGASRGVVATPPAPTSPKVRALLQSLGSQLARLEAKRDALPPCPDDPQAVGRLLHAMVEADQFAREGLLRAWDGALSESDARQFTACWGARTNQVDETNTRILRGVVAKHGWPTISRFGNQADGDAWLLVQHADRSPEFQRQMLKLLEPLAKTGETRPQHFAYLFDRVASHTPGALQRFGTQGAKAGPHDWQPKPAVEDPANLDRRRAAYGLGPFADYKKRMDEMVGP